MKGSLLIGNMVENLVEAGIELDNQLVASQKDGGWVHLLC